MMVYVTNWERNKSKGEGFFSIKKAAKAFFKEKRRAKTFFD
jgi:hypothetical protein